MDISSSPGAGNAGYGSPESGEGWREESIRGKKPRQGASFPLLGYTKREPREGRQDVEATEMGSVDTQETVTLPRVSVDPESQSQGSVCLWDGLEPVTVRAHDRGTLGLMPCSANTQSRRVLSTACAVLRTSAECIVSMRNKPCKRAS